MVRAVALREIMLDLQRKLATTTSTNSTAMTLYRTLLRFSAFFSSSSFSALGST